MPGATGATGATGGTGGVGPAGVCDCLDLPSVNLNSVTINTSLTMTGIVTCPGGAMDPNCFGLATCPDFSACRLEARALDVYSPNSTDLASLDVGINVAEIGGGKARFGRTTRPLHTFTAASNVSMALSAYGTPLFLQGIASNVVIESIGTTSLTTFVTSTGTVNIIGTQAVSTSSSSGVSTICGALSTTWNCINNVLSNTANNYTVTATDFTFTKPSTLVWFETASNATLQSGATGPLTVISGSSIRFAVDVLQANAATWMSESADGCVRVSGLIMGATGKHLRSEGTTLQLQNDTATKVVDIHAVLTNSEAGNKRVTVADADGLDVTLGAPLRADWVLASNEADIANHTLHLMAQPATDWVDVRGRIHNAYEAEPVTFTDVEGVHVATGSLKISAAGTLQATSLQATVANAGNVININTYVDVNNVGGTVSISKAGLLTTVNGDLTVSGTLTASGCAGCVTSDERVKTNVKTIDPQWDLSTILNMPRRVSFQYTRAFREATHIVDDIVQHGYLAHDVERVLPHAVHKANKTIAGKVIADFRSLFLDRIGPHLVGAVKALHVQKTLADAKHAVLQKEHEALKAAHGALKREVDMMRSILKHLSNKLAQS